MTSPSSSSARASLATATIACCLACSSPNEPASAPDPVYTKIDDMEGTSGRIAWTPQSPAEGATPGRWVSYADVQCEHLSPIPEWQAGGAWSYAELSEAHETFPDVASERAARLRTSAPLDNTWGAGMGFEFSEPAPGTDSTRLTRPCTAGATQDLDYPAAPVDLRAYSGIVFWASAKATAGATRVLVQFQDRNTDPRGAVCDPVPGSADECYNGFGVRLTLSDELVRYEIDFSELEQNPLWGHKPEPSVFDAEHVYGLVFQVNTPGGTCVPPTVCPGGPPKLTFDLWIDDLYFVKR